MGGPWQTEIWETGPFPIFYISYYYIFIYDFLHCLFVCVEVLRPSYLTTRLLGRLSPLSG